MNFRFLSFFVFFVLLFSTNKDLKAEYIINLIGDWKGTNSSYSLEKGYRNWQKVITIFEQNKRIFKGKFHGHFTAQRMP